MGLFKRAHVRGMSHYLTSTGLVSWPSKLAEEEAADAVADALEETPEVTDVEGLTPEEAKKALVALVEVAEAINEEAEADPEVNKEASYYSIEDMADYHVTRCIEKAAAEETAVTGPDVPGSDEPLDDTDASAEGYIDAINNPSQERMVPQGTSKLDTRPGVVGKEILQYDQPGYQETAPDNEAAKQASISEWLQAMAQTSPETLYKIAEADDGRLDLPVNLVIPNAVASQQGTTALTMPQSSYVGKMQKNPSGTPGTTANTDNEPSKDAYKQAALALRQSEEGRQFLNAIAKEAAAARGESIKALVNNLAHI
jgi:hypothetical protein